MFNVCTGSEDVGLYGGGGSLVHGFVILFLFFILVLSIISTILCCSWWCFCNACFKICGIILDLRVYIKWDGIVWGVGESWQVSHSSVTSFTFLVLYDMGCHSILLKQMAFDEAVDIDRAKLVIMSRKRQQQWLVPKDDYEKDPTTAFNYFIQGLFFYFAKNRKKRPTTRNDRGRIGCRKGR